MCNGVWDQRQYFLNVDTNHQNLYSSWTILVPVTSHYAPIFLPLSLKLNRFHPSCLFVPFLQTFRMFLHIPEACPFQEEDHFLHFLHPTFPWILIVCSPACSSFCWFFPAFYFLFRASIIWILSPLSSLQICITHSRFCVFDTKRKRKK